MRKPIPTFLACIVAAPGQAQQPPAPKPQTATPQNQPGPKVQASAAGSDIAKFSSSTQLVIETINVKDKSGNPVLGLTAKDFTVTEDGVPQAVKFFEFQKLEEAVDAEPLPPVTVLPAPVPKLAHTAIAPEPPDDIKYRHRRLMALYFDLTAMPQDDQLRAFDAAKKFVQKQMTKSDLMAIMMFAGAGVQVLVDFTADRDKLLSTLETLIVGEDQNAIHDSQADTAPAFAQDDS